jgi:Autographiviridae endonuclease
MVGDNGNGYRYIHCRPYRIGIHVVALVVFDGPLSEEQMALHRCDHRWCCNPLHLFRGTQLDNIHDMDRKGRRVVWHPSGETNPAAKLTRKQVQAVRESSISGAEMARELRNS